MRDLVEIDATHEDKRMIGVTERVRIFGITPTRPEKQRAVTLLSEGPAHRPGFSNHGRRANALGV